MPDISSSFLKSLQSSLPDYYKVVRVLDVKLPQYSEALSGLQAALPDYSGLVKGLQDAFPDYPAVVKGLQVTLPDVTRQLGDVQINLRTLLDEARIAAGTVDANSLGEEAVESLGLPDIQATRMQAVVVLLFIAAASTTFEHALVAAAAEAGRTLLLLLELADWAQDTSPIGGLMSILAVIGGVQTVQSLRRGLGTKELDEPEN
jgi:phage tail protein X